MIFCNCIQFCIIVFVVAGSGYAFGDELHCAPETEISNGKLVVCWTKHGTTSTRLLIHFHGDPITVQKAFSRSGIEAVLAIVNFPGLSSAYSKPFEMNPDLFQEIQRRASRAVGTHTNVNNDKQWKQITVSSFSAGYGSVREILKTPLHFNQISAIITADSIYAGLQKEQPRREVDTQDMLNFLKFASQSVSGKKSFLISHSAQQTPYASTTETANYLLQSLKLDRKPDTSIQTQSLSQNSSASRGQFQVLGFNGTSGNAHMQHLHNIDLLWKQSVIATLKDL